MKILLLLASLLVCYVSSWGQTTPDSLLRRLAGAPADTNRVLLLGRLTNELQTADAQQSLRYGQEGLRLARQLHYGLGEALLLNEIAGTYFAAEDLASAARYYQQAVRKAQALPPAGRQLTLALLGLGRVAVMQHDYPESQRYLQQVMRRIQQRQYPVGPSDLVKAQNTLGIMYFDWLSSGKAYPDSIKTLCLRYNSLALQTLKRQSKTHPASLAVALNGVGSAQRILARYDSAIYYNRAALRLFERLGSSYDIAQTQVWMGEALVAQGHAAQAVPMLRSALAHPPRWGSLPPLPQGPGLTR
jgi:tetratricopeptide (TPR) repeat protein